MATLRTTHRQSILHVGQLCWFFRPALLDRPNDMAAKPLFLANQTLAASAFIETHIIFSEHMAALTFLWPQSTDFSYCLVKVHPKHIKTMNGCFVFNAEFFTPIRKAFCLSQIGEKTNVPAVCSLVTTCSPSAIAMTISERVVYSIQRPSGRPLSHILKKIRELFPSFTNRDPFTAVITVRFYFRVYATLQH